jgi:hypothetical protein
MLKERGVDVVTVLVPALWNPQRIRTYWKLEGVNLLDKIVSKLFHVGGGETTLDQWLTEHLPEGASLQGWARAHGAGFHVLKDLSGPAPAALVSESRASVLVFTGGGLIRAPLLTAAPLGVLNCHPGLLPRYRGSDPIQWAEWYGDPTGLTVHVMDAGVDTGPILMTRAEPRAPGESIASYKTRTQLVAAEMLADGAKALLHGEVAPKPQRAEDGVQYFGMHPRLEGTLERLVASAGDGGAPAGRRVPKSAS